MVVVFVAAVLVVLQVGVVVVLSSFDGADESSFNLLWWIAVVVD